jgi:hypothetical protein
MGGYGVLLSLDPVGPALRDGELYYTVRDFVLDGIFSRMTGPASRELRRYLDQEDVFTYGSDQARCEEPGGLLFAFDTWGEGQDISAQLATHCYELLFAHEVEAIDQMAKAEGSSVLRHHHVFERVAASSQTFWISQDQHTLEPPERAQMCGWCGCELCRTLRRERGLEEPSLQDVPRAWALLEPDATGARLARQVGEELREGPGWGPTPTSRVLADWLGDRGVVLPEPALLGLAWRRGLRPR